MIRDHYTCIGCGLTHRLVEAGGVWYCPNPLCSATGAAWFRGKLPSFSIHRDEEEVADIYRGRCFTFCHNYHTVDVEEWYRLGLAALQKEEDEEIRSAGYWSARKMEFKYMLRLADETGGVGECAL